MGAVLREGVRRMESTPSREEDGLEGPAPLLAMLHCGPTVEGLYAKFGFSQGLPIPYARLFVGPWPSWAMDEGAPDPLPSQCTPCPTLEHGLSTAIRLVNFASDYEALNALRTEQVERCGVIGWTPRNREYWLQWVNNSCKGRAGVFISQGEIPRVIAYGYVRWRDGAYRVMDWANEKGFSEVSAKAFLQVLCQDAHRSDKSSPPPHHEPQSCNVAIPLPLAVDIFGKDKVTEAVDLCDNGWMVRALGELGNAPMDNLKLAAEASRFIIFQADNF